MRSSTLQGLDAQGGRMLQRRGPEVEIELPCIHSRNRSCSRRLGAVPVLLRNLRSLSSTALQGLDTLRSLVLLRRRTQVEIELPHIVIRSGSRSRSRSDGRLGIRAASGCSRRLAAVAVLLSHLRALGPTALQCLDPLGGLMLLRGRTEVEIRVRPSGLHWLGASSSSGTDRLLRAIAMLGSHLRSLSSAALQRLDAQGGMVLQRRGAQVEIGVH